MKLDKDDIETIAKTTVQLLENRILKLCLIATVAYIVIEKVLHRWLGWI
jgi:hypothetical protein